MNSFCHSSLHGTLLVLSANTRTLNSNVKPSKSHSSYFTAFTCIYISFLPKQQKTLYKNKTVFTSFVGTHSYQQSLCFGLLMDDERQKGKGPMGGPVFPFPSMSSFLA